MLVAGQRMRHKSHTFGRIFRGIFEAPVFSDPNEMTPLDMICKDEESGRPILEAFRSGEQCIEVDAEDADGPERSFHGPKW